MSSRDHVSSNTKFLELDVLRSADGVKAVISQRTSNGVITFAIVREYERDGVPEVTDFFPENLLESKRAMLDLVKARIAELRKDPKIMPAREMSAGGRR